MQDGHSRRVVIDFPDVAIKELSFNLADTADATGRPHEGLTLAATRVAYSLFDDLSLKTARLVATLKRKLGGAEEPVLVPETARPDGGT